MILQCIFLKILAKDKIKCSKCSKLFNTCISLQNIFHVEFIGEEYVLESFSLSIFLLASYQKNKQAKRKNSMSFYLCEIPRLVKFIKTESTTKVSRDSRQERVRVRLFQWI